MGGLGPEKGDATEKAAEGGEADGEEASFFSSWKGSQAMA